jgi:HK97 family phage major capsid protein
LDPTVIITSDGSLNEIRKAARQVVATGDTWNGVSSTAVSFSWDGEAAEVSDDATTFAQPSIPVHKAQGFVPISIEALEDAANVTQEVGRLLAFGKDTLEATAFATGNGTDKPTGIVTAVTAQATASATTDTFAIADVYALDSALPARYRPNASWLANRNIYNLVRQFDTAGGAGLWERLGADVPPNLLGRPAYEAEGMDGTITALGTNLVLLYGDFSNYVIADRIGFRVEFIPHLFNTANNLPDGQRGWYSYFRVGADSVNDTAFELLDVT